MASLRFHSLRVLRPASTLSAASRRTVFDVAVKPSGKTIIRYGTGGRNSVSGHVATVFGCTGFLGRYLVSKLAKAGTQVIIPYRDADEARVLRPTGDLGQIVPMEFDLRKPHQLAEVMRHSDVVYNLVGRDYETKNFSYTDLHATAAGDIARIAREEGVDRLVHVSHINADVNSASALYRSKAEGEELVREAFPEAAIVRPSAIFGYEDRLCNLIGKFPFLYAQNHGQTEFRPVHMLNVAEALKNLMDADLSGPGQTFNLAGPKTYTHAQFMALYREFTMQKPWLTTQHYPKSLLKTFANVSNKALYWPFIDGDLVERQYISEPTDYAIRHLNDGSIPAERSWQTLLAIDSMAELDTLEDEAIRYWKVWRSAKNFQKPAHIGSKYKHKRPYRVIE